jgi:hypothetical protein
VEGAVVVVDVETGRRRQEADAEGGAVRADRRGRHGEDGAGPAADVGHAGTGRDAGGGPVFTLVVGGHLGHHPVAGALVVAQGERIGRCHGPIDAVCAPEVR